MQKGIDDARRYARELGDCLNKNSVDALREFMLARKGLYPASLFGFDAAVWEIMLRKCQCAHNGVFPKLKREAAAWLRARGYSPRIE